jgi:hypothetical protein
MTLLMCQALRKSWQGIDMDEVSAGRLRNVIPVLIEQRDIAGSSGASLASHLIDLAIVQLRLTIHNISEEELSEFSNFLSRGLVSDEPSE